MAIDAVATDRRGAGRRVAARPGSAPEDPAEVVRRLLGGGEPSVTLPPGGIAGIEQEYGVWVDGRQVDFADLIKRVAPAGAPRRFAFDARARIVRSGAIWTVDAPHAEVATPPRELGPGIASQLADDALTERDALRRRLIAAVAGPVELRGYSTHLNAFADDVDGWALVSHVADTYAPALMLLAERPNSPGLLVRPRPRRLEIGTEFLESREDLVAAAVAVLAVAAAAWPVSRGDAEAPLPPLDAGRLQHPWQRPGWFVAPDAFGDDLYRLGRAALLRLADGSTVTAGDRLAQTWEHLRPLATVFASGAELALVDDLVAGRTLLPLERGLPSDPLVRPVRRLAPAVHPVLGVPPATASLALRSRSRGRLRLSPEVVTWDQVVLRVTHPARTFYLAVPREATPTFEAAWASGALDRPLAAFAASAPADRVAMLDQTRPGVFDALEPPHLAAERLGQAKPHGPRRKSVPPLMLPVAPILPLAELPTTFEILPPLVPLPLVPPLVEQPPVEQPPVQKPPTVPPRTGQPMRPRPPWQRPPFLTGLIGIVIVVLVLVGIPILNRQPTGSDCVPGQVCNSPSASLIATASAAGSQCLPGMPCGSQPAGPSPSPSPSPSPTPTGSQCLPGTVCGSPTPTPAPTSTPAPTPSPTPKPTPRPTPKPTPSPTPDRTGPSIAGLGWSPDPVGYPLPGRGCSNNTTPSATTVTVTVTVSDPSGIGSVKLLYKREQDASTQVAPMTPNGGKYQVGFDTSADPLWNPANLAYVVQLGVQATDKANNTSTLSLRPGFTVQWCQ